MSTPGTPQATAARSEPPLARVMRPLNTAVERFIPSALIFAIVLTVLVALMALVLLVRPRGLLGRAGALG